MPNTFEILSGFLSRIDGEVEGREMPALPPEVVAKFRRFAHGQLSEPEQADLIQELNEHPDWVATLANEVKALRPSA